MMNGLLIIVTIQTMIGKDIYEAKAEIIEKAVENITATLKDKNNRII